MAWFIRQFEPLRPSIMSSAGLMAKVAWQDDEETTEATAKLIAAAPDLLEALQHVLDRATMPGFLRDEVKAAINKATQ